MVWIGMLRLVPDVNLLTMSMMEVISVGRIVDGFHQRIKGSSRGLTRIILGVVSSKTRRRINEID